MDYLSHLYELNPLETGLAALVMVVLGALWYSPLMFGKSWTRLSGVRPGDIRPRDARRNTITGVITSLIAAILLGAIALHAGERAVMLYAGVGFIWLFVMLEQMNHMSWERQPFSLFLLHAFRSLAVLMAGASVFYFWS